ncbi:DinB family protein [Bacillus tianshenii]|nr:DinB family protein [Bacillus tianshenii]
MKTIQKMYEHLNWANERILTALQTADNQRARQLFAHILCAEKVWLTRLQGHNSSDLPIWSDMGLAECEELVGTNNTDYEAFLTELTNANLDDVISYQNSTGKTFHSSIRDILTHVALHGQYHRGQINLHLRDTGAEPINVDFITFIR